MKVEVNMVNPVMMVTKINILYFNYSYIHCIIIFEKKKKSSLCIKHSLSVARINRGGGMR